MFYQVKDLTRQLTNLKNSPHNSSPKLMAEIIKSCTTLNNYGQQFERKCWDVLCKKQKEVLSDVRIYHFIEAHVNKFIEEKGVLAQMVPKNSGTVLPNPGVGNFANGSSAGVSQQHQFHLQQATPPPSKVARKNAPQQPQNQVSDGYQQAFPDPRPAYHPGNAAAINAAVATVMENDFFEDIDNYTLSGHN